MASNDPTRTLSIRDQFAAQMGSRFRQLKGKVREHVLRSEFNASSPKIEAFERWLREHENQSLLDRQLRPESPPESTWMRDYLRQGYAQGVERTRAQLRQQGKLPPEDGAAGTTAALIGVVGVAGILTIPTHEERLDLQHDRAFRDLVAILEAQDVELTRTLTDALDEGMAKREIASRLNERVDAIGTHRGKLLARTSVVRAHADGQLEEMQRLGVEEVVAEVEFTTAGDDRVCPTCKSLEGTRRSIAEARGVIPVHPQCRCAWVPVFD